MSTNIVIGTKVRKRSNKPFKSGKKIATVKDITVNPFSSKTAFLFDAKI